MHSCVVNHVDTLFIFLCKQRDLRTLPQKRGVRCVQLREVLHFFCEFTYTILHRVFVWLWRLALGVASAFSPQSTIPMLLATTFFYKERIST